MSVAQLTSKGQILVPKHLQRKLGLKPGGKVHPAEEEGRLVLTPVPPDPIQAATGFEGPLFFNSRSSPRTPGRGAP